MTLDRPSTGTWGTNRYITNTGAYDRAGTTGGIANTMYQRGVGVGGTGGLDYGNRNTTPAYQAREAATPGGGSDYGQAVSDLAKLLGQTGTPVANGGGVTPGWFGGSTPFSGNFPASAMGTSNQQASTQAAPPVNGTNPDNYVGSRPTAGTQTPAPPTTTPSSVTPGYFAAGTPAPGANFFTSPTPTPQPVAPTPSTAAMTPEQQRQFMLNALGYGTARPATPQELAAAGWGGVYSNMANP